MHVGVFQCAGSPQNWLIRMVRTIATDINATKIAPVIAITMPNVRSSCRRIAADSALVGARY